MGTTPRPSNLLPATARHDGYFPKEHFDWHAEARTIAAELFPNIYRFRKYDAVMALANNAGFTDAPMIGGGFVPASGFQKMSPQVVADLRGLWVLSFDLMATISYGAGSSMLGLLVPGTTANWSGVFLRPGDTGGLGKAEVFVRTTPSVNTTTSVATMDGARHTATLGCNGTDIKLYFERTLVLTAPFTNVPAGVGGALYAYGGSGSAFPFSNILIGTP